MSRSIMEALPRADKLTKETLGIIREAEGLTDHVELAIKDASATKREHLLHYLDEARRSIQNAVFRISVLKAEIAHLSVEEV